MFRYHVVWSGMARDVRRNFWQNSTWAEEKIVVDFLVYAVKGLFPVGVPSVLQSTMDGVDAENGSWWKVGNRLFHGCDFNAFLKKAVLLESLVGLGCLKSFILL